MKGTVLIAAAVVAGCSHGPPAPAGTPAAALATATPVQLHVGSNGTATTVTQMKRGRTIYTIRAASFVADSAGTSGSAVDGTFIRPRITFVDRSGGATLAQAPKAELSGSDKSVLMTGGVRARSQDGDILSCDRLRYDGTTERVHGVGDVRLVAPSGLVLTGDLLDGDARLRDVQVRRR